MNEGEVSEAVRRHREYSRAYYWAHREERIEYERERRARLARELKADEGHKMHGTLTGYSCGCRCDDCTAAMREYSRRWRAAREAKEASGEASRELRLKAERIYRKKRKARKRAEALRRQQEAGSRAYDSNGNGLHGEANRANQPGGGKLLRQERCQGRAR